MSWLPYPFVSLGLCVLWLLLNQTLAPAHVLLGAAVGIAAPLLARGLQPQGYPRLRRARVLARLLAMAAFEIVRSCFDVCRVILFADYAKVDSQFIRVPLTLRDPYGLAVLSCLINLTPGTVWVEILADDHELVLHVFDLHDADAWVGIIQTRYERPLIEIFEAEGNRVDLA
ncbi:Na+/H+ antiporter subunit E [uncultured Massilia sp.]|uniref:Na+/H+ antiporter subunit E n=1 Tax=uncultured Massilia sp. TaxID=169973 RepID=UPI0025FB8CA6|nr:Na+/H+ antiporter subunit E [uncultured Massilia sp.]